MSGSVAPDGSATAGGFRWAARMAKLGLFRLSNPQEVQEHARAVGELIATLLPETADH